MSLMYFLRFFLLVLRQAQGSFLSASLAHNTPLYIEGANLNPNHSC
jgi:hypothetical protein